MPQNTDRSARWRLLWQPPSSITDAYQKERSVGFLELFYDLVFVVVVAQLAHHVADHPGWSSYAWFVLLLTLLWSAWLQGSFYVDAHGTTDLSMRVLPSRR